LTNVVTDSRSPSICEREIPALAVKLGRTNRPRRCSNYKRGDVMSVPLQEMIRILWWHY